MLRTVLKGFFAFCLPVFSFIDTHASPYNVEVGASLGYQRGWGQVTSSSGLKDAEPGFSQKENIRTDDMAGQLFFQLNRAIAKDITLGLRPYYHWDNSRASFSREITTAGVKETYNTSVKHNHAFGVLLVPQFAFKDFSVYGLLGTEWSKFKVAFTEISENDMFSKQATLPAFVLGGGISKEIDNNFTVFSEVQFKFYRISELTQSTYKPLSALCRVDTVKISSRYTSIMVGIKYKLPLW